MAPLRSVPEIRWGLPLRSGLAVSGWLAWAAFLVLPDGAPLRVLVMTVFLLLCPGMAAARWAARPAPARGAVSAVALETAVLTVVLSISLSVLAVVAFYLSGAFTTARVLIALAVVTSGLALFPRPGGLHRREAHAAPDDTRLMKKRR